MPTPVRDISLPPGTVARLAQFARWTASTPPAVLLAPDGAPSAALLDYSRDHGLSMDWLFSGDATAWAIQAEKLAEQQLSAADLALPASV